MSAYLYARPTTGWPVNPAPRADGSEFSIDDLAVSGVLFANAYAPSPLDAPSAATLLLGRAPWQHGLLGASGALPADSPTLAERFAEAGFQTTAILAGEALTGVVGLERGFDDFAGGLTDDEALERAKLWTSGSFDRPRLLWLHLDGPRWPFAAGTIPERPPALFDDPAAEADAQGAGWNLEQAFVDPDWVGPHEVGRLGHRDPRLGPEELAYVRDRYDGALFGTAWRVRDFLRAVAGSAGLFDETLFIVTGLRGLELGEHLDDGAEPFQQRFGHDTLMETTLAIPLILRHPRSLTGRRILADPVGLADVAPTLYDWFRLEPLEATYGRSLLAATDSYIERPFEPRNPVAVLGGPALAVSVGDGTWRATWRRQPPSATLHRVAGDPWQLTDLADELPDDLRGWAFEARRHLSGGGRLAEELRAVLEGAAQGEPE